MRVRVWLNDQPDIICTDSSLFCPIEFICFIWWNNLFVGRIFRHFNLCIWQVVFSQKKQNKIQPIKQVINSCSCNKKIVTINKKNNDKIESLEIKLN